MASFKSIKFYILVPVYNVETYIEGCIQSVLQQRYSNFELIMIDDGTPDRSGEVCEEYAKKDDRIKVIHQKNMGQIAARQTAIRYVEQYGNVEVDYCIFLDSDDRLKPNSLDTIVSVIEEYGCDLLMYGYETVRNNSIIYSSVYEDGERRLIVDKRILYRTALINNNYNSLCRKAVKAMLACGHDFSEYYGIMMGEDLLQSLEIYKLAHRTMIIPDVLYEYTENPQSITHKVTIDKYLQDLTVKQFAVDFMKQEKVWDAEDYCRYFAKCRTQLIGGIKQIGYSSKSLIEKKNMLTQLREHDFITEVIADTERETHEVTYKLFCSRQIRLLLILFWFNGIKVKFLNRSTKEIK